MADLGTDTSLKVTLLEIEKKVEQAETDRDNLKANLSNKGVDTTNISKMSGLISVVKNIELGKKWASGIHPLNNYGGTDNLISFNGLPYGLVGEIITIENLGFKPRVFIAYRIYNNSHFLFSVGFNINRQVYAITGWSYNNSGNASDDHVRAYKENNIIYFSENKLCMPFWYYEHQKGDVFWLAFE